MSARAPFLILVLALMVLGASNIYYRHVKVGIPLTAGEQIEIWQVEAEIIMDGRDKPATVTLNLPSSDKFELIEEFTASPAFGVSIDRSAESSRVVWSKREVSGLQTLYYQAAFKPNPDPPAEPAPVSEIEVEPLSEPYESSAQSLLQVALASSGDQQTLVDQVLKLLTSDEQNAALLLSEYSRTEAFVQLMNMAKVPTKPVRGLLLEDARRNQSLVPLVKVYVDKQWELHDIEAGQLDDEIPVLVWLQDQPALLDVVGAEDSRIRFAISKRTTSALREASTATKSNDWDFSLYHLPIAEQNLFKGILLLPIGALVVVFLRIMVGIRCSGTFMPILIATSFIQTELINGVVGFLAIVSVGLLIRSYLSHLNLLLVSRISAVVIVVIGIIVLFTMIAFRLGLTEALTITFFPMIIMAWTIERMSILWEEEGGREVLVQGMGSLIVAVIAYLMMDNNLIRHWAFNFLGVHALVMAAILLMGQYTGYRLLELRRFKPLLDDASHKD